MYLRSDFLLNYFSDRQLDYHSKLVKCLKYLKLSIPNFLSTLSTPNFSSLQTFHYIYRSIMNPLMDANRVNTTVVKRCGQSVKNVISNIHAFPDHPDVKVFFYSLNIFFIMEDKAESKQIKENKKEQPDQEYIRKLGEESLAKLRAMSYDNSRIGKCFVILPPKRFIDTESSVDREFPVDPDSSPWNP